MTYRKLAFATETAAALLVLSSFVVAQEDTLPVCVNNGPYVAECTGQVTAVPVTSAGSFDPDGTSLTYLWFEECPYASFDDPSAADPNMLIDLLGGCTQTCHFALRVSSGGQTKNCLSTVTVQDTTPPLITCPPDVVEIWTGGPATGQIDPLNTGFATAVDCDPNPVIAYTDVSVGNTMAGEPELIVTRTWTATDYCGQQSNCVQTITLLSPSQTLGAVLDVIPGTCDNELSRVANEGMITVTLYGTSAFDVSQVDRSTLAFRRHNNVGNPVTRAISKLLDKGRAGPNPNQSCGSSLKDGRLDLQLTFSLVQVQAEFALDNEASGSTIELALTGRLIDGRYFTARDTALLID